MKFGVVNKSTTVNRFVLHTLQRSITLLAVITRITNIKLGILKEPGYFPVPPLNFNFEKSINAMKFAVVNKSKTVNIFGLFSSFPPLRKNTKKKFKNCSHGILHVKNAVQICSLVHAHTF